MKTGSLRTCCRNPGAAGRLRVALPGARVVGAWRLRVLFARLERGVVKEYGAPVLYNAFLDGPRDRWPAQGSPQHAIASICWYSQTLVPVAQLKTGRRDAASNEADPSSRPRCSGWWTDPSIPERWRQRILSSAVTNEELFAHAEHDIACR